ncbi:MAG: hypothetical protein J7K54_00415 [Candidatus Aenigmarchaeota archaeon]|nr:hypothetical protein [Candidatus Aenigmarchaeota archaeon]
MKRETIRKMLKNYKHVTYTRHAELRCNVRGIDKSLVEKHLLNPNKLIHVKQEGELKYKVYFELSHARTLMVVIALGEKIKVITPKIIINKMQKGMWSKWKE